MKISELRFVIIEHPIMMIIAAVLITIGNAKAKRKTDAMKANKLIFIFYVLTIAVISAMVPWSLVLA